MLLDFKVLAVDFDGTLCENKWPKIGKPHHKIIDHVKKEKEKGHKIILWTCRVEDDLQTAINWCKHYGIEFDAVNDNVPEIKERFAVCGPKIYYDELIDDRHCTKFEFPYNPEEEHSMLGWAEREIEIACAKERAEKEDFDDWDYGCACYESAYRAFKSLCKDGHSGTSISLTKYILDKLIDGAPLTTIEDAEDSWNLISNRGGKDNYKLYQCRRMSSLFKYVYDNGEVKYSDVNNNINVDIHTGRTYHSSVVQKIMDEMFPVKMPYRAPIKATKFYCEDFLMSPMNGDFDTVGVFYVYEPNGKKIKVNRFFKEGKDGFIEISRLEYMFRKLMRVTK